MRKIIEGLGLEIATPDEAREILDLKGGDTLEVYNSLRAPLYHPAAEEIR